MEGVDLAERMLNNILQTELIGVDAATWKQLDAQTKNLGNYYIGGI